MKRLWIVGVLALLACSQAFAQYVWPKPGYNVSEPGLYTEDPFIVEYRKEFFAVFRGDFARFERAFSRIQEMVKANPEDARALVWLGNGQMVRAGLLIAQNKRDEARPLFDESLRTMDKAVTLSPDDPNIYMMRAATIQIMHMRFPREWMTSRAYQQLLNDSTKFIAYIGERLPRTSIHLRGEAIASLAMAREGLGQTALAVKTWRWLAAANKGTTYEERALAEVARLSGPPAVRAD